MFEKTKELLDSFLDMGVPGFDFLVYRDGKEFFRHMGGYSDLESKTPICGDEFRGIYSCTKPITVTAAMQLWEQGKFSLDDPLSDYLPAFKSAMIQTENGPVPAKNPLLIHNLFSMTGGLAYNYKSEQLKKLRERIPHPTTRQVADTLAQDLIFEPGDHYQYSLCHDVLGALIEEVSGESFDEYVKNHIFDPLGMASATMHPTQEDLAKMSPLYRFNQEQQKPMRFDPYDRMGDNYVSGGGGCMTTIEDYMKFAEALRCGEKLLKRSTIEMMATDRLTEQQRRTFTIRGLGYGLGIWAPLPGQLRQDFGWGGAAGALLAVDPGRGLSMVYMQHLLLSPNQNQRGRIIRYFLSELEGIEIVHRNSEYTRNDLTY